ncbi:MAG: rhomboid family intramembrane serine protease [Pseudomonadota bacterium]
MSDIDILERNQEREPVFNVPSIILSLLALLFLIHFIRENFLGNADALWVLFQFAFIPARYSAQQGGIIFDLATLWTPISYSFLHGDWAHLIVNSIWLLAFGSVVARRFEWLRFSIFCISCSCFGALAHYIFYAGSPVPMIGASAIVSGCMGAAVRFAFPSTGQFSPKSFDLPVQKLSQAFKNRQVVVFTVVWFSINLLFGLGGEFVAGQGQSIAWEAHVGGFLCGLLLFKIFDRRSFDRRD